MNRQSYSTCSNMNQQPYPNMNQQVYPDMNHRLYANTNQQTYTNANQQKYTNMNQQQQYSVNQHSLSNVNQQNQPYLKANNQLTSMNQQQAYSGNQHSSVNQQALTNQQQQAYFGNQQTHSNINQQNQSHSYINNQQQQEFSNMNYQAQGHFNQNTSSNQSSNLVKVERNNVSAPSKFFEAKKPVLLMPVPAAAQRKTYSSSWQKQGPMILTSGPSTSFTSNDTMNTAQNGGVVAKVNEDKKGQPQRKRSEQENVRFLTGNIEKVLKWHRLLNEFCHYEVFGPVISIQEGTVRMQKVMLLRDKKGPVLKIVHYVSDRIDLPNFHLGQAIRCVGRMINVNTLQAIYIREARNSEIAALPRMYYICDQEVARTMQNKSTQEKA